MTTARHRKSMKSWYAKKGKAYFLEYRKNNKARITEIHNLWLSRNNNKQKVRDNALRYYYEHREECLKKFKEYYNRTHKSKVVDLI